MSIFNKKKDIGGMDVAFVAIIFGGMAFIQAPEVFEYFRTLGQEVQEVAQKQEPAKLTPEKVEVESILPSGVTLSPNRLLLLEYAMGAHDALVELPDVEPGNAARAIYMYRTAHPRNFSYYGPSPKESPAYEMGHAEALADPNMDFRTLELAFRMPDTWYGYLSRGAWSNGGYRSDLFADAFREVMPPELVAENLDLADMTFALLVNAQALEANTVRQEARDNVAAWGEEYTPPSLDVFSEVVRWDQRPSIYLREALEAASEDTATRDAPKAAP